MNGRPAHHPCPLVAASPIDLVVVATFGRLQVATTTKSMHLARMRARAPTRASGYSASSRTGYRLASTSRMSIAVSLGVLPTLTPAASRASFFPWAVPAPEETMAPA